MARTFNNLASAGMAVVTVHVLTVTVHSAAHASLQIFMAPWQNAYILSVIVALPIVAGVLLWRRRQSGFLLLFVSMAGSLVFGGYYHFLAPGPDNISELGHHAWTIPFQVSAMLLAIIEAAGAAIGVAGLLANRRRRLNVR